MHSSTKVGERESEYERVSALATKSENRPSFKGMQQQKLGELM